MSSSETQKTPQPDLSLIFKSEKPHLNSKLRVAENDSLSSKTPEKTQQLPPRSLRESTQKQPEAQIESARRKIETWPEENPIKTHLGGGSDELPEKFEILGQYFDGLDASIRLLRLRGMVPSFNNIRPKIECLTDRRFTYGQLSQLKLVLPEVIVIKRVVVKDERTGCTKPELHVSMNVDGVERDEQLESEGGGGHMHLRRAFRKMLADIWKSHPEGYEIPEKTLPQLFNSAKQDLHSDTVKFPLSSSHKVFTDVHIVEKPEASATCLQGDEISREACPALSDQSNEDVNSNISDTPDPLLPINTSFEAPIEQQPALTTHLPPSFKRHFSLPSFQGRNVSVPESNHDIVCSLEEASSAASSYGQVPATPTKKTDPIENDNNFPKSASIESTPAKLASTPARLMSVTPALHPPKPCYMRPNDNSTSIPAKLVRRPPRSRSLKFDTPVIDEVLDVDGGSIDNDNIDILPEDLLHSLKDKEGKSIEERNPAILQEKGQQQMISGLPKLFNTIHSLFQSRNCFAITKQELVHKIIWTNYDVVDSRNEVEEQLTLLLELVPEWISEKDLAPGADLPLICINKKSNPDSIRARLQEAM